MGTWDTGPFDNDNAADWCGELHDANSAVRPDLVREALARAADEEDYLECHAAEEAIAAAALAASQRTGGPSMNSAYAPEFLRSGGSLDLPDDIAPLAVRALDRILGEDSEWRKLWDESPDAGAAAVAVLADLRVLLSA